MYGGPSVVVTPMAVQRRSGRVHSQTSEAADNHGTARLKSLHRVGSVLAGERIFS
jgi:hypothetical protein